MEAQKLHAEGGWVQLSAVSSTINLEESMAIADGRHAPEQDILCLTWQMQLWAPCPCVM